MQQDSDCNCIVSLFQTEFTKNFNIFPDFCYYYFLLQLVLKLKNIIYLAFNCYLNDTVIILLTYRSTKWMERVRFLFLFTLFPFRWFSYRYCFFSLSLFLLFPYVFIHYLTTKQVNYVLSFTSGFILHSVTNFKVGRWF